jgi:cytochrome c556
MNMGHKTSLLLAITLFILFPAALAMAHGGAKGIVKECMELMKSVGKAMKGISKMARGKAPLDSAKVATAARTIDRHGQRIPAMFPKGSDQGVTEASPNIWQNSEGFKKSAD